MCYNDGRGRTDEALLTGEGSSQYRLNAQDVEVIAAHPLTDQVFTLQLSLKNREGKAVYDYSFEHIGVPFRHVDIVRIGRNRIIETVTVRSIIRVRIV